MGRCCHTCKFTTNPKMSDITKLVPILVVLLALASWNTVGAIQPEITGNKYGDTGFDTTLRCLSTESFSRFEWRTSVMNETDFFQAVLQVRYIPPDAVLYRDKKKYSFDKDDPENPLTIKNFTKDDVVRYWCRLETSPLSDSNFVDLFMREPATIDKSTVTFQGEVVKPGDKLNVKVGVSHDLKFSVTGILPAATFKWLLDTTALPETTVNSSQSDGLITSTSTVTWTPADEDDGKFLYCTASNGAPEDVAVQFKIKTTEPTMNSSSTSSPASKPPTEPAMNSSTPSSPPSNPPTATGLSIGIIIGIVVGSLCVFVITVGVGIAILKYNSKNGVTPDSNQSKKGKKKEAIEEEHV